MGNNKLLKVVLIGRLAKYANTRIRMKYYQETKTSLFIKKWYNIGNILFGFYVNLAKASTDIKLENR
jgi:hypothetical protein